MNNALFYIGEFGAAAAMLFNPVAGPGYAAITGLENLLNKQGGCADFFPGLQTAWKYEWKGSDTGGNWALEMEAKGFNSSGSGDAFTFNWTSHPGVEGVIAKAATEQYTSAGGTKGTVTAKDKHALSNIVACYIKEVPTNTPKPTSTTKPSATYTLTFPPLPTLTKTPSDTPTEYPTATLTLTPLPSPTSSPTASATYEVTLTYTPGATPTDTRTPYPGPSQTPTNTPLPSPTLTITVPVSVTPSLTPGPTNTPISSPTNTPYPGPSQTPTNTPIPSPTNTPYPGPSDTPGVSPSPTTRITPPHESSTPTFTPGPSNTPGTSPSPTYTPTDTVTPIVPTEKIPTPTIQVGGIRTGDSNFDMLLYQGIFGAVGLFLAYDGVKRVKKDRASIEDKI